ncbi:MAG: tetratricopeptide repeat protein, partial [bacterium]|nr:tetratricopeptide repeat protein [bacterium]
MKNLTARWGLVLIFVFICIFSSMQMLWTTGTPEEVETLKQLTGQVTRYKQEAPKKAKEYGKQALRMLRDHPDDHLKVTVLNGLCWAHSVLGEYREALRCGKEAENIARLTGSKKELAVAFASLANVYLNLSEFHKALDYSQKAASAGREIGYKKGTASALVSTARIQRSLEEYEKALVNYRKALDISRELGNKSSVAWILNNTATVYWDMKNYDKALDIYFYAMELMKEVGSELGH